MVALAFAEGGEATGRASGNGPFGGRGRAGRGGHGRDVPEQVAQKAAGAVDGGAVVGEAAQDVGADGGRGVTRREPGGDELGQFVVHAPGDAAEVGGEAGEGGDEGAGGFGDLGCLGGGLPLRLGGTVGGVFPEVFPWMTGGGRRGRSTDGRNAGTRGDLR